MFPKFIDTTTFLIMSEVLNGLIIKVKYVFGPYKYVNFSF